MCLRANGSQNSGSSLKQGVEKLGTEKEGDLGRNLGHCENQTEASGHGLDQRTV